MKKTLFLLLPLFLFGEITSNDLYLCNQGDYQKCQEVGHNYLNKFSSDYNPDRSQFPLKKACLYGSLSQSCVYLSSFYYSKNDFSSQKEYLKKACDLGDSTSCYRFNNFRMP